MTRDREWKLLVFTAALLVAAGVILGTVAVPALLGEPVNGPEAIFGCFGVELLFFGRMGRR